MNFVTVWGNPMKKKNNLIAPSEYWNVAAITNPNYINGCGGSGITTQIVPDNLLGLNISDACSIHDYMYEQGKNKKQADDVFLSNMISIIDQDSNSNIMKSLRKAEAYIYYFAVKLFGSSFFGASTN